MTRPRPRNERRFQEARRAAGLTGCTACRDTGVVTRGIGSGAGRCGFRMERLPCLECASLPAGAEALPGLGNLLGLGPAQ